MTQPYKTLSQPNANARPGGVDGDVIARAEAALKSLAGQFSRWLQDEIDKLEAANSRVALEGLAGEAGEALHTHAHDLKGLGGTYEFPIVTRMAGSLCRLLEAGRAEAPLDLINAHIETIKAVVRDGIRDEGHPVGALLATSLEERVSAVVGDS
ncbi:MAG: Hpt protein [Caulobacteraceae bacterium]|nr:Hpt protein [Caulobacteraceae bacterium]